MPQVVFPDCTAYMAQFFDKAAPVLIFASLSFSAPGSRAGSIFPLPTITALL
jgi:hypothetical protein